MLNAKSAALIGAFSFLLVTTPVRTTFAHAHLESQIPAANKTVDEPPRSLALTFSEDIEAAFSGAKITDAKHQEIVAQVARAEDKKNQLIVTLNAPLLTGEYEVDWHVLSVDGHKTNGKYSFKVK